MEAVWNEYKCCSLCYSIYRGDLIRCPRDGEELKYSESDPLIGITIADNYVIGAFLGEGATGRVYQCSHSRLTRKQYAIKFLLGDLAMENTMRTRFTQEAEAASRLSHPNVVSVIDFGETDKGLLYIVMELVVGTTLGDYIDTDGPLHENHVAFLCRDICHGLTHAHEHGLVHRDFKPDNIALLERDSVLVPRILDFGLAIVQNNEEASARLTKTGMLVGTPAYAAPEQIAAGNVDQRTDLFALGISMYQMLCGQLPFDGNLMEILVANSTQLAPPIGERVSGTKVSPEFEEIIQKLISKSPDDRFQTAREVRSALELFISTSNAEASHDRTLTGPTTASLSASQGLGGSTVNLTVLGVEAARQVPSKQFTAQHSVSGSEDPATKEGNKKSRTKIKHVVIVGASLVLAIAAGVFWFEGRSKSSFTQNAKNEKPIINQAEPAQPAAFALPLDPSKKSAPIIEPAAPLLPNKDQSKEKDRNKKEGGDVTTDKDHKAEKKASSRGDAARTSRKLRRKNQLRRVPSARKEKASTPPDEPAPAEAPDKDKSAAPLTEKSSTPPLPPLTKTNPPPIAIKEQVSKPKKVPALDAKVTVSKFKSGGSLPSSIVRSVLTRSQKIFRTCYRSFAKAHKRDRAVNIAVSFQISETRRASNVRIGGKAPRQLVHCVHNAVKGQPVRRAPDTGIARGSFNIQFTPLPPR